MMNKSGFTNSIYFQQIERLSNVVVELIEKIDSLQRVIGKSDNLNEYSDEFFLKNLKILTEDDWTRYKQIFQQVYPNYYGQIQSKYGDILSKAEIRMILLLKTTSSHETISSILGISKESVRVCVYRLRIKLNIKTKKELNALIDNIH
jgi:DNA-binding CsgD family transcriptional regulator